MATYIIDSLLNNDVDNFTDTLNIHVLPSTNPDGYEYSQKSDRLWRKTRSNYNSIFLCKGVDGNRNWDYHWAGMFYAGSPPLTPSSKYHGIILPVVLFFNLVLNLGCMLFKVTKELNPLRNDSKTL